jgi:hypothetical protein
MGANRKLSGHGPDERYMLWGSVDNNETRLLYVIHYWISVFKPSRAGVIIFSGVEANATHRICVHGATSTE